MITITLHSERQPDGMTWLVPTNRPAGCERDGCTVPLVAGEIPDTCEHLHAESMDAGTGEISWLCGR